MRKMSQRRAIVGVIAIGAWCVLLMTVQTPSEVGTPGELAPELSFMETDDFMDGGDESDFVDSDRATTHRVYGEKDWLHPMNPRGHVITRVGSHVPSNIGLLAHSKSAPVIHTRSRRHRKAPVEHVAAGELIQGESLSSDQADEVADKGWAPPSTLSMIKDEKTSRHDAELENLYQSSSYYQSSQSHRKASEEDTYEDEYEDEDEDEEEEFMDDDDDEEEKEEEAVEEDEDLVENHLRKAMKVDNKRDGEVKMKQLSHVEDRPMDQWALTHPIDAAKKKREHAHRKPHKITHVGAVPSNSALIGAKVITHAKTSRQEVAMTGNLLSHREKMFISNSDERSRSAKAAQKQARAAAKAAAAKKKEEKKHAMPSNIGFLDDSKDRKKLKAAKKKEKQDAHKKGKFEDSKALMETLKQKEIEKVKKEMKQREKQKRQQKKKLARKSRKKKHQPKKQAAAKAAVKVKKKVTQPGHLEDLSSKERVEAMSAWFEALEQDFHQHKKLKAGMKKLHKRAAQWLLNGKYVHAARLNDLVSLVKAHRGMSKADLKKLVDEANENGDPAEVVVGKVTAANAKSAALKAVVKAARKSVPKQAKAAKAAIDTVFAHAKTLPEEDRLSGSAQVQKEMVKLLPLQIALQKKADSEDNGALFCGLQWYQTLFQRSVKNRDDSTVCWADEW